MTAKFHTKNMDLAAFIIACGYEYESITRVMGSNDRAEIYFAHTDELTNLVLSFEQGGKVEGKKLLLIRSKLFRLVNAVLAGGAA